MPAYNNENNWIKTMMKIATTILQQRDAYGCTVNFFNTMLVIFSFFKGINMRNTCFLMFIQNNQKPK